MHACVRTLHTGTCECLRGLVTNPAPLSPDRLLAHICLCPGVDGELRIPDASLSQMLGATRHNAYRHFLPSVPSNGNRAGDKWCSVSRSVLQHHHGWGPGSPPSEQACMSPAGPCSGPKAVLFGGVRLSLETWSPLPLRDQPWHLPFEG